jgi:hypothetical protein
MAAVEWAADMGDLRIRSAKGVWKIHRELIVAILLVRWDAWREITWSVCN